MAALLALAGPMVVGVAVRAQTTGTRGGAKFEVATIKLDPACRVYPGAAPTPGRMKTCGPLRVAIQMAYRREYENPFNAEARGGPSWIDDVYEIVAKAEGNPSNEQMGGPMLQALLEERLRLKVHRDQTEGPVYFLKVAKGGPKFQPAKKGSCVTSDPDNPSPLTSPKKTHAHVCGISFDGRSFDMYSATMGTFAGQIAQYFDRRLIDKTGLSGVFDIHMDLVPEDAGPPPLAENPGDAMVGLRAMAGWWQQRYGGVIVPALQKQLGLTVESGKGPGDTLVIDHIERPSPN